MHCRTNKSSLLRLRSSKDETFQLGYANENGENFESLTVKHFTAAAEANYYASYNADSFYQLDFSEDPFDGKTKTDVQIKNTGNTDAYIRVAVVVNWKTSSGNIWAKAPEAGTDYTLVLGTGWKRGNDGYYYYSLSVPATDDQQTGIDERVIGSFLTIRKLKDGPTGSDGARCELSVEILASAIQTTADAVTAWSSGVAEMESNGMLTVQAANAD